MKRLDRAVIALFSAAILAISPAACGSTYTGRIAVKGHEPFADLYLVTDSGDLKIVGPLKTRLWNEYQGRRITVKGSIVKKGRGILSPPELQVSEIASDVK